MEGAKADWNAIQIEYITTNASYRELAKKYKLSRNAVSNRGKAEGWVELRRQHLAETVSESLDKDKEKKAQRLTEIFGISDSLLEKIKDGVQDITSDLIITNPQSVRHLTGALKDLKDILCLKGELETEEQKARIAILKKQAQADDPSNNNVRFELDDELDEFAV